MEEPLALKPDALPPAPPGTSSGSVPVAAALAARSEGGTNIVIFSDGTANRGAKAQGTNVWALYERLERGAGAAGSGVPRQIAFYDDGVGTQTFLPLKLLGGIFGWGLYRNVRELYTSIVRSYTPGDALYLFGFSRGAYTVRTLAGLLTRYGVLKRERFEREDDLARAIDLTCSSQRATFAETRRLRRMRAAAPEEAVLLDGLTREDFHHQPTSERPYGVNVRFLGVWDTVDAVGLPFDGLAEALNRVFQWRFADRRVSGRVERARQALSIDDERRTFLPNLWDEGPEQPTAPDACPHVEQVWFAGVHTNVGGGYDKDQLAYLSLDWMLGEASREGLRFPADARARIRREADPLGLLVDSRAGMAGLYRYRPRDVAQLSAAAGLARPGVHASVLARVRDAPLGYAPVLLPEQIEVVETPVPPAPPAARRVVALPVDRAARDRALGLMRQKQWLYTLLLVVLLAPPALLFVEQIGDVFASECARRGRVPVLGLLAGLALLGVLAFHQAESLAFGSARAPALRGRRWRVAGIRLAYVCALLAAGMAVGAALLGLCGEGLLKLSVWLEVPSLGAAFRPWGLALWYGLGLAAVVFGKQRVERRLRVEALDALAPTRRALS